MDECDGKNSKEGRKGMKMYSVHCMLSPPPHAITTPPPLKKRTKTNKKVWLGLGIDYFPPPPPPSTQDNILSTVFEYFIQRPFNHR